MNAFQLPFAIMAFLGFVLVVPAWGWFVGSHTAPLSMEASFLATLILPATVAITVASWLQTG